MRHSPFVLRFVPSLALALAVAASLRAQDTGSMHVTVSVPDSIAHIVDPATVAFRCVAAGLARQV
jgi:hypothetical protein